MRDRQQPSSSDTDKGVAKSQKSPNPYRIPDFPADHGLVNNP
jgi:hypothetical protein